MRRHVACGLVLGAVGLIASPALSASYYGFRVGITNAPAAPRIRVAREPHLQRATDAMVYVVADPQFRFDGDLFRYGQYWFAYAGGFWYRARSHRGPYAVMDVRRVPRAILGVPRPLWKHHPLGPPPARAIGRAATPPATARGPAVAHRRVETPKRS